MESITNLKHDRAAKIRLGFGIGFLTGLSLSGLSLRLMYTHGAEDNFTLFVAMIYSFIILPARTLCALVGVTWPIANHPFSWLCMLLVMTINATSLGICGAGVAVLLSVAKKTLTGQSQCDTSAGWKGGDH